MTFKAKERHLTLDLGSSVSPAPVQPFPLLSRATDAYKPQAPACEVNGSTAVPCWETTAGTELAQRADPEVL